MTATKKELENLHRMLIEVGFPHNWQHEALHIRNYMRDISRIINYAYDIYERAEKEEETK